MAHRRILFLQGTPVVSGLNQIKIGAAVPALFAGDAGGIKYAVKLCSKAIVQACKIADNGTASLPTGIILMQEAHGDWLDQLLEQIEQIGLPVYLATCIAA